MQIASFITSTKRFHEIGSNVAAKKEFMLEFMLPWFSVWGNITVCPSVCLFLSLSLSIYIYIYVKYFNKIKIITNNKGSIEQTKIDR